MRVFVLAGYLGAVKRNQESLGKSSGQNGVKV